MLTQVRVHDTSIVCKFIIIIVFFSHEVTVCSFKCMIQTVRHRLVRSENTEVLCLFVQFEDITYKCTKFDHILFFNSARFWYIYTILTEVWETKISKQKTTVCMWVCTDTCITNWCKCFQFWDQLSILIEKLFRFVTEQPFFQLFQMFRFLHCDRHLVSTERIFDLISVIIKFRTCPSLRSTKNDHWPDWALCVTIFTSIFLDCFNLFYCCIKSFCHLAVHVHDIVGIIFVVFYKDWFPSASLKEVFYFFMRNTSKYSRVADLVSV